MHYSINFINRVVQQAHCIKLIASASLLTKILADFLFGFYLLTLLLKHTTNHTQNRYQQLDKND